MNRDVDMDTDMDTGTETNVGQWRLDIKHSTLNIEHRILYTDMNSDMAMKIKPFKI